MNSYYHLLPMRTRLCANVDVEVGVAGGDKMMANNSSSFSHAQVSLTSSSGNESENKDKKTVCSSG